MTMETLQSIFIFLLAIIVISIDISRARGYKRLDDRMDNASDFLAKNFGYIKRSIILKNEWCVKGCHALRPDGMSQEFIPTGYLKELSGKVENKLDKKHEEMIQQLARVDIISKLRNSDLIKNKKTIKIKDLDSLLRGIL